MKKVGMILKSKFPPDIRVEKEANSLISAGYEIYVLCNKEAEKPSYEICSGIHICRLMPPRSKLDTVIGLLLFKHPVFKKSIDQFIKRFSIDFLHIHDLPLANSGLEVAKKYKIPVVLDFHENYPAAITVWRSLNSGIKHRITSAFSSYGRWILEEKRAVKRATRVIVVVDEMRDTLLNRTNIAPERVQVITNTESKNFLNSYERDVELENRFNPFFTLLYSGGIGPHRGIDTVIKALKIIRLEDPNIRLVLVGTGSETVMRHLRALAIDQKVDDLIFWENWQPFNRIGAYMKACNVGLVPHNYNEHTDNTIPHKIFQHMLLAQPLIVSSCRPISRIVNETKSGLVFQADDPSSLSKSVLELKKDPELRKKLGDNGLKATIENGYLWEKTGESLISLYKDISAY